MEEVINMIQEYIIPVTMLICLCIGYVIKHSITEIPNKYIPLIMAILGVLINVWSNSFAFSPEILLGGLASGLASTGAYELVKNVKANEE